MGRYSFVGCNPRAVIRQTGDRVEVLANSKTAESFVVRPPPAAASSETTAQPDGRMVRDGLVVVAKTLRKYRPVTLPGLPRFTGGAVGFIGYEFIHDIEPVVPRPSSDEIQTPVMYFLIADQLLIFDRVSQMLTVLVNAALEDSASPAEAYEEAVAEIERLVSLLEQPSEHVPVSIPAQMPSVPFESNVPQDKFLANVSKAKEYITAGDIIQVVGSQLFSTSVQAAPVEI